MKFFVVAVVDADVEVATRSCNIVVAWFKFSLFIVDTFWETLSGLTWILAHVACNI